jgi:hypothetical protein
MENWTLERLMQLASTLDAEKRPVIHIDIEPHLYFTFVGDTNLGRADFSFHDHRNSDGKAWKLGLLRDKIMAKETKEIFIDYKTEHDFILLSHTVSIDDALKVVFYFVEFQALPLLPDYLYWEGNI